MLRRRAGSVRDLDLLGEDRVNGLTYWWDGHRRLYTRSGGHQSFWLLCDGTREAAERLVRQAIAQTPLLTPWDGRYS